MSKGEGRYALAAARLLGQAWPDQPGVGGESRRDQVVAAMELDIAKGRRRRRAVAFVALTMAAAAALIVGLKLTGARGEPSLVVKQTHGPRNLLVRAAASQPLTPSVVLLEGDDVRCDGDGSATLGLANGTQLILSGSSRVRVDTLGHTRRFSLVHGWLDADVSKLAPDERFIVGTPDSQVEVRGTRFSVGVTESSAGCRVSRTRSTVKVREGSVWVRSRSETVLLGPGESWTAPCADLPTETRAAVPATAPAGARPVARLTPAASPSGPAPDRKLKVPSDENDRGAAATSRLAEQNDLLSAAMTAERAGQHEVALRTLDDLLKRYPKSPLLETARIERQRIMSAQARPPGEP